MPWVKLDDRLTEHPKVLAAGPLAIAMQVAGLCYCNRELTDGFIPRAKARSLLDWEFVRKDGRVYTISVGSGMQGIDIDCQWVIDLLVEAGIWEYADGGYQIHDFGDYQPSREQVESERQATAKRQANWRSRHKGSNGLDNGGSNEESNAVTNSGTNGPVTSAPVPVPVPHVLSQSEDCSERGETPLPPFDLLETLCKEIGSDPSVLSKNDRSRQMAVAKRLRDGGVTTDEIRGMVGYLQNQDWVTGGIDLFLIEKQIGKWKINGQPDGRSAPRGNGRASPTHRELAQTNYDEIQRIARGEA